MNVVSALVGALILAGCGGSGSGSGPVGVLGAPAPAVVTLTATPTTITLGQSVTLAWTSSAGTSCNAGGAWSGAEPASGTMSVAPTAAGTASFTIGCAGGAYGMANQTVTVTVNPASAYSLTALVANTAGMAANTDPKLVNAWGLSIAPPPATNPPGYSNSGTPRPCTTATARRYRWSSVFPPASIPPG